MSIILKSLFALGIVFLLLYVLLKIFQKYGKFGSSSKNYIKGSGLKIENIVYIDETMKIVNISDRLNNNYIIGVGKSNSFLIDKYQLSHKIGHEELENE